MALRKFRKLEEGSSKFSNIRKIRKKQMNDAIGLKFKSLKLTTIAPVVWPVPGPPQQRPPWWRSWQRRHPSREGKYTPTCKSQTSSGWRKIRWPPALMWTQMWEERRRRKWGTRKPSSWSNGSRQTGSNVQGTCHSKGLLTISVLSCLFFYNQVYEEVFYTHKIKASFSYSWRCPGTSAPSAAHLTVSLYLCSSGSNARGESRVRDGDEGVAGRNGRE